MDQKNILHLVLDNGVHDSTGGQDTVAKGVNFPACAQALNYPICVTVSDLTVLSQRIRAWEKQPQLTLLHVPIEVGSPTELGRPSIGPATVAQRLKAYVT